MAAEYDGTAAYTLLPHARSGHGQREMKRAQARRDDLSLGFTLALDRVAEIVEGTTFAAWGQNIFERPNGTNRPRACSPL